MPGVRCGVAPDDPEADWASWLVERSFCAELGIGR